MIQNHSNPVPGNSKAWILTQNILTLLVLFAAPTLRTGSWHWSFQALGITLFVVGAVFGVAGVHALGPNRTPHPKPLDTSRLVQTGIYRIVRHPLYTSLILLTLGWSLAWSSGVALVPTLGLAGLLGAKARLEERWLRSKFPEYDAYCQRVPRLLP